MEFDNSKVNNLNNRASYLLQTETNTNTRIVQPELEPPIVIEGKNIIVPEELKIIGVQNDSKAEEVTIKMKRFYDGIDLSKYPLYIDYLTPSGFADCDAISDIDLTEDEITFRWKITNKTTRYKGVVMFTVRFQKDEIDEEGHVTTVYRWGTTRASITILEGLDIDEYIAEMYPTKMQEWVEKMNQLEQQVVYAVNTMKVGKSAYQSAIDTGEFAGSEAEWVRSLHGKDGEKGERGDLGPVGPTGPIGPKPEKYVDYFTDDEVETIKEEIKWGVLTEVDKALNEIIGEVL